jgi:hypothetical protein
MRAELIRDLYSRRPETVFSQPLELQMLLWSLGYTDELVNERDMAAVEAARKGCINYNPDSLKLRRMIGMNSTDGQDRGRVRANGLLRRYQAGWCEV